MSQSSSGSTSVRFPCCTSTSPSMESVWTVSRATVRLTPKRWTISSAEGKVLPGPRRPDTISQASLTASRSRRRGSRRSSWSRCPLACRAGSDIAEVERRKVVLEQAHGRLAEALGRLSEPGVREHTSAYKDLLGAAVEVVDGLLDLEDDRRQHPAKQLVGEVALARGLGVVDGDEEIDQIDAGDVSDHADTESVQQVH